MFARVSTYRGDDPDQIRQGFEQVRGALEQMEGFVRAHLLVDRDGKRAMTITMWEDRAALDRSAERADQMRRTAAETGRASIESVDAYEVVLTAERATATA